MRLASLTVRDFRNLAALDIEWPADGAVIIGANGQGKTNLLEAIYYLVVFRSLRGAADGELVRFGAPGFFVAGAVADTRVTAAYETAGKRKRITVSGEAVRRLGDAVGRVVAVAFSPADRDLVTGGPARRRRYLDILLALSVPGYLRRLAELRAALKQRNAALRSGRRAAAFAFDDPVATAAEAVTAARMTWVDRWGGRFGAVGAALGETHPMGLTYRPAAASHEDEETEIRARLHRARERDLQRGTTSVGPHRDDLRLTLGDRALPRYGSAGQQRTAAIALRLIEAETLAEATGHTPIALYDDVFAELDEARQARLLELVQHDLPGQAIITAPRDSEVPPALFTRPRWSMQGGAVAR